MANLVSLESIAPSKLVPIPHQPKSPLSPPHRRPFLTDVDSFQLIEDQKFSHPLEDDEEHGSPPAAKKRRTDSASGDISFHDSFADHQHGAGHKIEEELATALGEGIVDSLEPTNHSQMNHNQPDATREEDPNLNPDVASIISEIMDHTDRQEHAVAMGPQEVAPSGDFPGAKGYAFLKANSHLKIQSLPILDNLVHSAPLVWTFQMLTMLAVDPDPFVPIQEQLSRLDGHDFGARLGEWPSLCNHALPL